MGEIEFTRPQIKLGVYVQKNIDAYGSCLLESWEVRDIFMENVEGLKWLYVNNLWQAEYDSILDLTRVTQIDSNFERPFPIEKLAQKLAHMRRKKET